MSKSKHKHETGLGAMDAALQWLQANEVYFDAPATYHLKIGPVNSWPRTGTITVDGEERRRTEHGLAGLEATLIAEGLIDLATVTERCGQALSQPTPPFQRTTH